MATLAKAPQKPSPFSVFRNRSFALLWTAQLITSMGNALTSLAASILVYRETGSTLSVGLMLIATAALTLFVGLIAGLIMAGVADRLREGQWLSISFIAMGILSLAFAMVNHILPALAIMALIGFFNAPSYIGRQHDIVMAVAC